MRGPPPHEPVGRKRWCGLRLDLLPRGSGGGGPCEAWWRGNPFRKIEPSRSSRIGIQAGRRAEGDVGFAAFAAALGAQVRQVLAAAAHLFDDVADFPAERRAAVAVMGTEHR